ncbi:hypothetical protein [Clavibacter michiganensis]|uniref:hypothetical protein n=1 Tax=Clavibacter michiganensis TaxID=28447 RepID=UPI00130DCACE|nr:hypothetical protein [Clavibacter michiganensis]
MTSGPATSTTGPGRAPSATSATTPATASSATGWIRIPGTSATGPNRMRCRFCRANSNHCVERTMARSAPVARAASSCAVLPAK